MIYRNAVFPIGTITTLLVHIFNSSSRKGEQASISSLLGSLKFFGGGANGKHPTIFVIRYFDLSIPTALNILSNCLPASPVNGTPVVFSTNPGPSPTNTIKVSRGPIPFTTLFRVL